MELVWHRTWLFIASAMFTIYANAWQRHSEKQCQYIFIYVCIYNVTGCYFTSIYTYEVYHIDNKYLCCMLVVVFFSRTFYKETILYILIFYINYHNIYYPYKANNVFAYQRRLFSVLIFFIYSALKSKAYSENCIIRNGCDLKECSVS